VLGHIVGQADGDAAKAAGLGGVAQGLEFRLALVARNDEAAVAHRLDDLRRLRAGRGAEVEGGLTGLRPEGLDGGHGGRVLDGQVARRRQPLEPASISSAVCRIGLTRAKTRGRRFCHRQTASASSPKASSHRATSQSGYE